MKVDGLELFEHYRKQQLEKEAPLSARMQPQSFAEFMGQEHLVGEGHVQDQLQSKDKKDAPKS